MHFVVGTIGALLMLMGAITFWSESKKLTSTILILIGTVAMAWANVQWMVILLVISAISFIVQGFTAMMRTAQKEELGKRRTQLNIPLNATLFIYNGGHPELPAGKVSGWQSDESVEFTEMKSGHHVSISKTAIRSIDLHSDVQTVTTGGGRSLTGAVIGDVVAGPIGAIVGGTKKAKTKTIDQSTVHMRVTDSNGTEISLVFKGGQSTYNTLTSLLRAN